MSRVPREDGVVQRSIRQHGWKDVGNTDLVITEWPAQYHNPAVPSQYPNPNLVQGPYPKEPLSEVLDSTTSELVLDFLKPEDQEEIARLRIKDRCWMIVDGNNRQTGIVNAIQDKNPKVPVCARVIVNIYFTFNLYYCRVVDISFPWDPGAPLRPAPTSRQGFAVGFFS